MWAGTSADGRHERTMFVSNPETNGKPPPQTWCPPSSSNVRELEALAPACIGWYGEHPFIADVGVVLENLKCFFRYYPEFDEKRAITALDPYEFAERLASLIISAVYEGLAAAYSLMQFMNFLHDSGRWFGSSESYRAVNGILTDIICLDMSVRLRTPQV